MLNAQELVTLIIDEGLGGLPQRRPFSVRIPPELKRQLRADAARYGVHYGIFFSTSGQARMERINPTAQYQYLWRTDQVEEARETVIPAIRYKGKVFTGDTHPEAMDNLLGTGVFGKVRSTQDMESLTNSAYNRIWGRCEIGWRTSTGRFVDQVEASRITGIKDAHGEDIRESKRGPEIKRLKKGRRPLTPEERKEVMDAGAVWHHGPNGEATPAVWKSVVDGKTWYVCNTHRAGAVKPTLRGAIRAFDFIKTTS